jgi:hypothetical protein
MYVFVDCMQFAAIDPATLPAGAAAKGLNEMWLIHGTSTTDPDVICQQRGIDPHYAAAGLFGRAAYFAEFTSYSDDGYRYNVPGRPGVAQLLLVRVAAGLVQVRSNNARAHASHCWSVRWWERAAALVLAGARNGSQPKHPSPGCAVPQCAGHRARRGHADSKDRRDGVRDASVVPCILDYVPACVAR